MEHAEYNGADGIEQTIQTGTVIQEKLTEFFRNRKNTMPVVAADQFACHGGCPLPGIKVTARWTETGMAAKRDKVKMPALGAAVHGTAEGGVTAVDHLINVFDLRGTGMKSIHDFFVVIAEDFLEDVHKTIMKKSGTKENPQPLMIEGQGS